MSKFRDFLNSPYNPPLWAQIIGAVLVFGIFGPFILAPTVHWLAETLLRPPLEWLEHALGLGG